MKVYTCGYMHEGTRYNWRHAFVCKIRHPNIEWLHPDPDEQDAAQYLHNDWNMIKECSVVLIYVDLSVARYLGAMMELGMAWTLGKRILMVDMSPEIHSLEIARMGCCYIVHSEAEAIKILEELANEN